MTERVRTDSHVGAYMGLALVAVVASIIWFGAQADAILGCGHPLAHLSASKAIDVLGGHGARLGACVGSVPPWPGPLVAGLVSVAAAGACVAIWLRAGPAQIGFAPASLVRTRLGPKALAARASTLRPQTSSTASLAPEDLGIYLGRARPGGPVWASVEDSILVLGPPRSGKTTTLLVPALASFPGPVLATSTRADLVEVARRYRADLATFDPQGVAPTVATLRWSPVWGSEVPMVAVLRARALALGAGFSGSGTSNADFWSGSTAAVLRCLLHAAALDGGGVEALCVWATDPDSTEALRVLSAHPDAAPGWAAELDGARRQPAQTRGGVWAGVQRALDVLAVPAVRAACSPTRAEAWSSKDWLSSRGALLVLGASDAQASVAPLLSALIEDLLGTARSLAAASPGARLDPPLGLLLDEAPNIAPIPSLPILVADGGGTGFTTVVVAQSLAQLRHRWGQYGAQTIWDATTARVVLEGLGSPEDLEQLSRLVGEVREARESISSGRSGSSRSVSMADRRVLRVDQLRCLAKGEAILVHRSTPPVRVALEPYWRQRRLTRIADELAGAQALAASPAQHETDATQATPPAPEDPGKRSATTKATTTRRWSWLS